MTASCPLGVPFRTTNREGFYISLRGEEKTKKEKSNSSSLLSRRSFKVSQGLRWSVSGAILPSCTPHCYNTFLFLFITYFFNRWLLRVGSYSPDRIKKEKTTLTSILCVCRVTKFKDTEESGRRGGRRKNPAAGYLTRRKKPLFIGFRRRRVIFFRSRWRIFLFTEQRAVFPHANVRCNKNEGSFNSFPVFAAVHAPMECDGDSSITTPSLSASLDDFDWMQRVLFFNGLK